MGDAPVYRFKVLFGEKRVQFEEHVRLIMPRPKWWQWRYRKERAAVERLAAAHGMKLYEA